MSTLATSEWVRVTKHNSCQVCGKPDWCRVLKDGTPICSRIESPIRYDNGGWLHKSGNVYRVNNALTNTVKQSTKATIDILNCTYQALLSELPLLPEDRENLIKRGLSDSQISSLNYKTMPLYGRENIIEKLLSENVQLSGIPGFWTDLQGEGHLSGPLGICVPVRDLQGRISGIQIRRNGDIKPKYVWLSSSGRLNGCSSGVSAHLAKPAHCDNSEVWITEGPLKGDIISLKLNRAVIAIPGVAAWEKAIPIVWQLKVRSVIVALDMDKLTNQAVMTYKNLLINRLMRMGIRVFEASWNSNFKGLDDLLAIGVVK
jgi:DNA primase